MARLPVTFILLIITSLPCRAEEPLFLEETSQFSTAVLDGTALSTPPAKRHRIARVRHTLVGTYTDPASTLTLNVFSDTILSAIHIRSEALTNGGLSWIGHLENEHLSQVVLILRDGRLTGTISLPGANYSIRNIDGDLHRILENDHSTFPQELEPLTAPTLLYQPSYQAMDTAADETCADITVLVAYTPEARSAEGGTENMLDLIDLAIAETNQSYINSGLSQRITLAHTMETTPGDAANSFYTDLPALQNLYDGTFDDVDSFRELYHADLVGLIIENFAYCGLGYLNSTASTAFTVTHRTCATGYYSFGHELGHNMGARHDWYVDDAASTGKGFINLAENWRTVMGYNTYCSDNGENCSRIQYWSNPDVTYSGDPMGVSSAGPTDCIEDSMIPDPSSCAADNRARLNSTCDAIADFRVAPPALPDLIVFSPRIDETNVDTGQSFTFIVSFGNKGGTNSAATTVRYYISADTIITGGDNEIENENLGALAPSQSSTITVSLTAPTTDGSYYIGACADSVSGEISSSDNCSDAIAIAVSSAPMSSTFPWTLFLPSIITPQR